MDAFLAQLAALGVDPATLSVALWSAAGAVVSGIAAWGFLGGSPWPSRLLGATGVGALVGTLALLLQPTGADAELDTPLPERVRNAGYASSDTCRSCHPGQYESWHHSFHRTMTQVATPTAVVAPFDGRVLSERGHHFQVARRGDGFYFRAVTSPRPLEVDEAWFAEATRLVMTTGSHHMQAYWFEASNGELQQLPFVFLIREQRWLANSDSFLEPPHEEDDNLVVYTWSDSCVTCHSTGGPWDGREDYVDATPEVRVTEFGISCEACHGPGEAHVEANRSPARRYRQHEGDGGDPSIVNPGTLSNERSSSICGRCHSVHPDGQGQRVHEFRPGERLDGYLSVGPMLELTDQAGVLADVSWLPFDERDTVGSFWTDGSARVAGREHSAMVRSGCYLDGEMACTTCHSMHDYRERAGQMAVAPDDDAMCTDCHAEHARDVEAHTHHAADSVGSRCVSCHMPYTAYALLMATRSHRMDGPRATGRGGRDRPNACNLCHLDRSIGWAEVQLSRWYGGDPPSHAERTDDVPAGVHWMLRGDATQRGIAAWHMGYGPTQAASDLGDLEPALRSLLGDPYSAVRQVAGAARRRLRPDAELDMEAIARDPVAAPLTDPRLAQMATERNEMQVAIPE